MSISKLSTKSTSNNFLSQKSIQRREFFISGEFITGKSDFSLDLDSSASENFSLCQIEIGNKELRLLQNLEALDASLIPENSDSISIIREFNQPEECRIEAKNEEIAPPRSLMLENSQYKGKPWCFNCISTESKTSSNCILL